MNISRLLATTAFATLAAGACVAAQAGTSAGEGDPQSPYALQIRSSTDRAAVALAAARNTRRTSVGEGSGIWAQDATRVPSAKSRADVRQNAIQAARAGHIASGEATFV